jgi:hypothetical protein
VVGIEGGFRPGQKALIDSLGIKNSARLDGLQANYRAASYPDSADRIVAVGLPPAFESLLIG